MAVAPQIVDIREESAFIRSTFSGYSKSHVIKELLQCIYSEKIENACYWSAELICSGQFKDLWDAFFLFFSQHVHPDQCILSCFLYKCTVEFRKQMYDTLQEPLIALRNSDKIRQMVAQIVLLLCCAKRRVSPVKIKVQKDNFDMVFIRSKFRAPNIGYAEMDESDPKELFPFFNELSYQLNEKDQAFAIYWVEWILGFANICSHNKVPIKCKPREYVSTTSLQTHVVWVIWDTLLVYAKRLPEEIRASIHAIHSIFCLKFTLSAITHRKGLIYYAMALICEPCQVEHDCITKHGALMEKISSAICAIYAQIKKHETAVPSNTCTLSDKFSSFHEYIPRK